MKTLKIFTVVASILSLTSPVSAQSINLTNSEVQYLFTQSQFMERMGYYDSADVISVQDNLNFGHTICAMLERNSINEMMNRQLAKYEGTDKYRLMASFMAGSTLASVNTFCPQHQSAFREWTSNL